MRSDVRHSERGAPRARTSLIVALACGTLTAAPAAAQVRFAWPDTAVPLSGYNTVDKCLALVARTHADVSRREMSAVRRDTLPYDPRASLKPLPAPVVEIARRCAAQFPEPTARLDDFAPLLRLYLDAGRDADASALVARRFAAAPPKSAKTRAAIEDSVVAIYLDARPARLDAAEQILLARARREPDRLDRMVLYGKSMQVANAAGDTAQARRAARLLVNAADSLTTAERESEKFEKMGGRSFLFPAVMQLMGVPVMLDSLRRSTAALVTLERSTWAALLGESPDALPVPIGEHAPTISADYWIPAAAGNTPRPAPGHVSLILFLEDATCITLDPNGEANDQCGAELSMLRRLSERFPTLDVIVVSRTHGFFAWAPPMTPAEEADMLRRWIDTYHIPRLTIALTSTPFWNLPRPDGRRINKDTPNFVSYTFGKRVKPEQSQYLVDQDGLVVSVWGLHEQELAQFIDVLTHRQATGGDRAAK
ncbi:MAG: hypothetical protein IRY91_07775 [Gemmatimonadaceae bacterium]|nr:hypothetical protein [Gemmatimonadaceae bacterium]